MHRNELIRKLKDYQTEWENESDTVERLIEFVLTNEDCFERNLEKGHITGSAWVVSKDGRQVLLTHHKKLNRWLQLGGHADGNSDVLGVAMREAQEESMHRMPELKSNGLAASVGANKSFETDNIFNVLLNSGIIFLFLPLLGKLNSEFI